jgi:ribosome-binding factor A
MSSDLRSATAFVIPLAGANSTQVIAALQRRAAFLKGLLAHEVPLRYTPNLAFALDRSFDEAERIHQLLARPEVARDLQPQPAQSEVPGDEE